MAIVSFIRQNATCGNEIAERTAHKLGYKLITGTDIESKILRYGFPKEKLVLFNEKRPKFWNSVTRERELYFNYLKLAVLSYAADNNCVFVGKGAFKILQGVQNMVSFNITAPLEQRVEKTAREQNINHHKAGISVLKTDSRQREYYRDYFKCDIKDPTLFDLTITAPENRVEIISDMISSILTRYQDSETEKTGIEKVNELLAMQALTNLLVIEYELPITGLDIKANGKELVLSGIAESSALSERAVTLIKCEMPGYTVRSEIRAVQDLHSKRGL